MPTPSIIFSFIVDDDPAFVYSGWHLAQSLIQHCGGAPSSIVVQFTPEVAAEHRTLFRDLDCRVLEIARFGDGRYCNKINQLKNLESLAFDQVVLLDTDMIAVSDLRPFLHDNVILGKIVDSPNPPLAVLTKIAELAGLPLLPAIVVADTNLDDTYFGNCNGGLYSIPRACVDRLSAAWRKWALWLLANPAELPRGGHAIHTDQVSFWLALQHMGLPFRHVPSNVNYFTHLVGDHRYFDAAMPLALLHYHTSCLDDDGHIIAKPDANPLGGVAVALANEQFARGSRRLFALDPQFAEHWRNRDPKQAGHTPATIIQSPLP